MQLLVFRHQDPESSGELCSVQQPQRRLSWESRDNEESKLISAGTSAKAGNERSQSIFWLAADGNHRARIHALDQFTLI